MQVTRTDLPDVLVLEPARFKDSRGWFSESWSARHMAVAGIDLVFEQDNHSFSAAAFTLRGLHYQCPPMAQAKLVRCTRGRIFDVAVDLRRGSAQYGRWTGVELDATSGRQLLVPVGFLHAFLTLTPDCEVQYKCTAPYAPACDGAIRWDDPDLAIRWPLPAGRAPLLSDKDATAPLLAGFTSPFAMGEA